MLVSWPMRVKKKLLASKTLGMLAMLASVIFRWFLSIINHFHKKKIREASVFIHVLQCHATEILIVQ